MKKNDDQVVGIYGGTFDPIHLGHLSLVVELMELHHLAEVWWCPARISPHRAEAPPIPVEHRLKMVELALVGLPQCKVLEIEARREGPSFTMDTLRELVAIEAKSERPRSFRLLLGEDAVAGFFRWKAPEAIVEMAPLIIGHRSAKRIELPRGDEKIRKAILKGMTPTRIVEISSTLVRERLAKGLYCGHLVPTKVLEYIYQHRLYQP